MSRRTRIPTAADIRRMAVARSLFPPTSLQAALETLGFVQADPIRAPARAQDLTLRHRVAGYRAGDLERLYPTLDVHEDHFINYGFVTSRLLGLMHPRTGIRPWNAAQGRRVPALLDFVRAKGAVHPREVDQYFAHGTVMNYWGGTSSATTHLLEHMHYAGLLRVVRRETGIRLYGCCAHGPAAADPRERHARLDALVDIVVRKYAPVPSSGLSTIVGRLRYAVPQWRGALPAALTRARRRLPRLRAEGVDWFFGPDDPLDDPPVHDEVRLLAPFDPVVWDRQRFERLWEWAYRFEAYTPEPKRKLGYYALPLLWRDRVIGWATVAMTAGALTPRFGYVVREPRDATFRRALECEVSRLRVFLGLG